MKIIVDLDKCIAAGSCVAAAPELFDQRDDDGIVILLQENPSPEQWATARSAAGVCPAAAISLEE